MTTRATWSSRAFFTWRRRRRAGSHASRQCRAVHAADRRDDQSDRQQPQRVVTVDRPTQRRIDIDGVEAQFLLREQTVRTRGIVGRRGGDALPPDNRLAIAARHSAGLGQWGRMPFAQGVARFSNGAGGAVTICPSGAQRSGLAARRSSGRSLEGGSAQSRGDARVLAHGCGAESGTHSVTSRMYTAHAAMRGASSSTCSRVAIAVRELRDTT